ncbi:MAG: acetyltransferase [Herbaspirillum sp.]|jgi:UDP-3-O-[3-hydroxymyristoyl] glucosamine N-acyltransferase|nr:acetyltransferase [Herbaspirillum sp.]
MSQQQIERVVLVGTGAVAEEIVEIFGPERFVACFTDPAFAGQVRVDLPVVTEMEQLQGIVTHFVLAFSGQTARARLRERLIAMGLHPALPLISPTAQISPSAVLARGAAIGHFVCVGARACIGSDSLIMHSASIAHDSNIGADVFCGQGVKISGHARVGERSILGANAVVARSVVIGPDVEIASGAVCFRDVPDGYSAIGNPARLIPSIAI